MTILYGEYINWTLFIDVICKPSSLVVLGPGFLAGVGPGLRLQAVLGWALGLFLFGFGSVQSVWCFRFRGMRLVGLHLGSIVFSYWWYFIKLCLGFHYILIFIQDGFLVKLFAYSFVKPNLTVFFIRLLSYYGPQKGTCNLLL